MVWQNRQNYERARQQFEAVIERYPQAPIRYENWLQLGIAHMALKAPQAALNALSKASKAPDKKLALQAAWHSGRAHSIAGDLQKGINAYFRVIYSEDKILVSPEDKILVSQALHEAARNYIALNKCPEALKVYEKFREQDVSAEQKQSIVQELTEGGCQL